MMLFVFKCLNGYAPDYLCNSLVIHEPTRSLRSANNTMSLEVPRFRTETYGRKRFGVLAPILWNELPPDLKLLDSVDNFKDKLKHYYFCQYFVQERFDHLV